MAHGLCAKFALALLEANHIPRTLSSHVFQENDITRKFEDCSDFRPTASLVPPQLGEHLRCLPGINSVLLKRMKKSNLQIQAGWGVPSYISAPISKTFEMLASPWFERLGRPHSAQSSQVAHPTSMPGIRRCVYKSERHLQYPTAQGKQCMRPYIWSADSGVLSSICFKKSDKQYDPRWSKSNALGPSKR